MDKIVGYIYETYDYDKFKRLEGNRTDIELRAKRIGSCIDEIGYVTNPIIVNEKNEIIDGQGRKQALQDRNLPIIYTIQDGIGIKECRKINANTANWKQSEYISSYAEEGNENYIRVDNLIKQFPQLSYSTVVGVCLKGTTSGSKKGKVIKDGLIDFSENDYENAKKLLKILAEFQPYLKKLKGNVDKYYNAISCMYKYEIININDLLNKISKNYFLLNPVVSTIDAVQQLEDAYNYKLRYKTYFVSDYKEKVNNAREY